MPEGAEVKIIASQLNSAVAGKYIREISGEWESKYPRQKYPLPLYVSNIDCKGKCIRWTCRRNNKIVYIFSTLGMTGNWQYTAENFSLTKNSLHKHMRCLFVFDKCILQYIDVRMFGDLLFTEELIKWNDIAPSLFDADEKECAISLLQIALKSPSLKLINVLLDQHLICRGIGNWVVNELLYACQFHPSTCIGNVTPEKAVSIFIEGKRLLNMGITYAGVSISDYVDIYNTPGTMQRMLKVYNNPRAVRIKGAHGRSAWYIPSEQPLICRIQIAPQIRCDKYSDTFIANILRLRTFACNLCTHPSDIIIWNFVTSPAKNCVGEVLFGGDAPRVLVPRNKKPSKINEKCLLILQ